MSPEVQVRQCQTAADAAASLAIRRQVFIEEQGVPAELELDAYDGVATAFLVSVDGVPLGTGRLRPYGTFVKFERIATLRASRGTGVGKALMAAMETYAATAHPRLLPYMHAQLSAVGFYERLGWLKVGALFTEAGIDHWTMIKAPTAPKQRSQLSCLSDPACPAAIVQSLRF